MSQNQLIPTWMQVSGSPFHSISTGATITSDAVTVEFNDNIGIQAAWTGTTHGTIAIQRSLDPTLLGWDTITFASPPTPPAGSSGQAYYEVNQTTAGYVRFVFTRTDGTGAMSVKIAAKSV